MPVRIGQKIEDRDVSRGLAPAALKTSRSEGLAGPEDRVIVETTPTQEHLPRVNRGPSSRANLAIRAGEMLGRDPLSVAVVVLGGAAAVAGGAAGVVLDGTLDAHGPEEGSPEAPERVEGHLSGVVGNDTSAPVLLAHNMLFGSGAGTSGREAAAPSPPSQESMPSIRRGGVLRMGDRGPEVAELQRRLAAIGFNVPETSEFGRSTDEALRAFQRKYSIVATGEFGAGALDILEAAERVTEPGRNAVGILYRDGVAVGQVPLVFIDGKPVTIETANLLRPMIVSAARAPRPVELKVVSSFRTYAEQKDLHNDFLRRRGPPAAEPGHSMHNAGIAVDFNTGDPGVYSWLKRNAARFDFKRTVRSEPWHWEYLPAQPR